MDSSRSLLALDVYGRHARSLDLQFCWFQNSQLGVPPWCSLGGRSRQNPSLQVILSLHIFIPELTLTLLLLGTPLSALPTPLALPAGTFSKTITQSGLQELASHLLKQQSTHASQALRSQSPPKDQPPKHQPIPPLMPPPMALLPPPHSLHAHL